MQIRLHPLPPLLALRAFESAGRLGTMTSAATELCVTPGAISRQVKHLEQYLAVALFEGPKNSPVLSPAGIELLSSLSPAMTQINAGVSSIKSSPQRVLTVSCLNTFAMKVLIPKLYLFKEIHQEIDVRLSTSALDEPNRSNYDVIINVRHTDQLDVTATRLFTEKIGPVFTPKLTQDYNITVPEDLWDKPVLHTRTRPNAWKNWWKQIGFQNQVAQTGPEFEHYYFTLEAAVGGLGICMAPEHLVIDDVKADRLLAPLGFVESEYSYTAEIQSLQNLVAKDFVVWLVKEVSDQNN